MEENLAIVGVFGTIPLIIWIIHHFRSKAHDRMTRLIGQMIEKGESVTPDTIRALGIRSVQPHGDLKTGMILLAIALAIILAGQMIPEEEAGAVALGLAGFPGLVGLAYLAFWFMFGRKGEGA